MRPGVLPPLPPPPHRQESGCEGDVEGRLACVWVTMLLQTLGLMGDGVGVAQMTPGKAQRMGDWHCPECAPKPES